MVVPVDAIVCVVASLDVMGPYRLLRSRLALLANDDPELARAAERWCPGEAIRFTLEPEPAEPVDDGARVAFFTTGPGDVAALEPVVTSRNLARRAALASDLERARAEGCDVYLTELKAAAVDTVAEAAERAGARLVFARNRPTGPGLDEALLALHDEVAAAPAR